MLDFLEPLLPWTRSGVTRWEVQIAHARKVPDIAPLACKTDKVDARVLAELRRRDRCPSCGCRRLAPRELRERLRQFADAALGPGRGRPTRLATDQPVTPALQGHQRPRGQEPRQVRRAQDPERRLARQQPFKPAAPRRPNSASASSRCFLAA